MDSRNRLQQSSATAAPAFTPAGRRPQICPSWMSKEEFEVCRSDPYQAFNAAQTKISELHQRVTISKKLNQTLLEDPQYKYGQAVQSFEKLKNEHIQLSDAYHDLEAVNQTLQEVTEVLRGDKHQLLVELNALKREITIQSIENQQMELKARQLRAFNESIDLKLQSQEAQLAQLDDDCKEGSRQAVVLDGEISALESTCQNYSLQSSSLSDLRQHLDTTRVAQDRAIQALEREVQSKAQEIVQHDAQLWEFKREMSGRILALQKKANECNDELNRLHRLSEHEINTLAAQNRALNDELKSTADALFATRREKTDFSTAVKKEIHHRKEEIQQCLSVLDLVERQNQGLEASILRLMEQNKLSERQIMEKDNINNKNLIEQANFISMIHMELQTTREDLYILKARLCRHCRETILADELEEERQAVLNSTGAVARGGMDIKPMEFDATGQVRVPAELTDSERQKMDAELRRTRDALETLSKQLLDERAARENERREEEEQRRQAEEDRKARELEEDAKRRRAREDERKIAAGEEAQTYTIRFVDGTRKKVDAFSTDTIGEIVHKICAKVGIRQSEFFHLAHCVNENSVIGAVDRFLDKNKTLAQQQINPKCNLVFKIKHYKRHKKWTDPIAQEWFFRQLHHNVISEYYPVSEKLAVELASLEIQSVFGDASGKKRYAYFDRVGLDSYLPVSVSAHEYEYWQERLFRWHKRRRGMSASAARSLYIDTFADQSPYWGLTFFDVSDRHGSAFLAGIGEDGMYIFTANKRELLTTLRFDQIVAWDGNARGLSIKKRGSSALTIFGTSQLQREEMVNLLNEYYMMLPQDNRDRLSIGIQQQEEIRAKLPPPDTFENPIVNRRKPVELQSRLQLFKAEYMEHYLQRQSSGQRDQPVIKMCQLVDKALDEGVNLEDFDLSDCDPPLNDQRISVIVDVLHQVNNTVGDPEQFSENIYPKSLNLEQPINEKITNRITQASVPTIVNFMKRYTTLMDVNLSGIFLDSKNHADLTEGLCSLPNLTKLVLRNCNIDHNGFRTIHDVFKITPSKLEVLDLEHNKLTHASIEQLCRTMANDLSNSCVLKHLNVSYNKIESEGLATLIATLADRSKGKTRLEVLKCGSNPFGIHDAKKLPALVSIGLTELSLVKTQMNGEIAVNIAAELRGKGGSITTLDLSRNETIGAALTHQRQAGDISRDYPKEFFSFLDIGSYSHVAVLNLSHCALRESGNALAKALVNNSYLKELNVSHNGLAHNGLLPDAWIDVLMKQRNLTNLNLSANGIKFEGLRKVFAALRNNKDTALQVLKLSHNTFEDSTHNVKDLNDIMDFLQQNSSVHELHLCQMGMKDDILVKIGEGLAHNRGLRILRADSNNFTTRGVGDFSQYLPGNTTLQDLDLSSRDVQMSDDTYLQAYKMLIDNSNVERILL